MRVNEAHSNLHLNSAYLGEISAEMVPETAALATDDYRGRSNATADRPR